MYFFASEEFLWYCFLLISSSTIDLTEFHLESCGVFVSVFLSDGDFVSFLGSFGMALHFLSVYILRFLFFCGSALANFSVVHCVIRLEAWMLSSLFIRSGAGVCAVIPSGVVL